MATKWELCREHVRAAFTQSERAELTALYARMAELDRDTDNDHLCEYYWLDDRISDIMWRFDDIDMDDAYDVYDADAAHAEEYYDLV